MLIMCNVLTVYGGLADGSPVWNAVAKDVKKI